MKRHGNGYFFQPIGCVQAISVWPLNDGFGCGFDDTMEARKYKFFASWLPHDLAAFNLRQCLADVVRIKLSGGIGVAFWSFNIPCGRIKALQRTPNHRLILHAGFRVDPNPQRTTSVKFTSSRVTPEEA